MLRRHHPPRAESGGEVIVRLAIYLQEARDIGRGEAVGPAQYARSVEDPPDCAYSTIAVSISIACTRSPPSMTWYCLSSVSRGDMRGSIAERATSLQMPAPAAAWECSRGRGRKAFVEGSKPEDREGVRR